MTADEFDASQSALARSLTTMLRSTFALGRQDRTVIAIAGESGSGKSSTATSIAHAMTADGHPTVVLHQDDYFLRAPRANHAHRCTDLSSVGHHEVDLTLLASHVAAFRIGRADVLAPRADAASDSFVTWRPDFVNAAVLVVEGTYVLHLDDSDIRIFLDATHEDTAERRRLRNRDVDAPIIDRILAIEHDLIAPQMSRAHIVIGRDFTIRVA